MAAGRHVLAIQDTSELNFQTSSGQSRGLGLIGKGTGRGLLLHPMLALDASTQECLGLVGGTIWTRAQAAVTPRNSDGKKKKTNATRRLSEKESRHWIETALTAKKRLSQAAQVTMIADREADVYSLWASVSGERVHVLGRAYHDRKLVGGGTLSTAARHWPVCGTRSITLREREGRPERTANLELRIGTITLPRPQHAREAALPDQVTLTLIELVEPDPPDGAEALLWRLLTTHTATNAEAAWQIVDWYRARWMIEQFFRTLKKQGFQIEDSQLETAERLIKLVAIAARAAVIVMQLVHARDGGSSLPASAVFTSQEIDLLQVLNASYHKPSQKRSNPHPKASLPWAAWVIARLGGWSGYTSKGSEVPGPITFKNGLDAFRRLAEGWALRDMYTP